MSAIVGMRVLRGPDWQSGDDDGGEGHLGTVVKLLDGDKTQVMWDHGQERTYRCGSGGKFDLRVFDTAPVGIRHRGKSCSACEEKDVYGMLWHCQNCRACDLCSLCYVTDKHDLKHEFLRICAPGSSGVPVKKRSCSLKIRSMGIFPGAKVKRGKDWAWADQDGGMDKVGEVVAFENVAPDSSRNIVRVQWPHGGTNSYRLGLQGNVDLTCVEVEAGFFYYREHLPVLSTVGPPAQSPTSSSSTTSSNSTIFMQSSGGSASASSASSASRESGSTKQREEVDENFAVGDKVVIRVDEAKLKDLQLKSGGCTATMIKCIGKPGEVVTLPPNGSVGVNFGEKALTFRFNPKTLIKVPHLSVGDTVRIRSDINEVKVLNARVGWKSSMEQVLGKVGQVTRIDSDGDVVVMFGRGSYMFSPACCIPVSSSTSCDSIGGSSSSSSSANESNDDYRDLHQDIMKVLAEQLFGIKVERKVAGGGTQGSSRDIDKLFKAIANGDTSTVRSICQQDKTLVNSVHKGLTPLIVACHEGQKDICSCLLAQGADINKPGEKGNTPLGAALEGKKENIALFLLEKGASPSLRNSKQRNPVHLAAYCNLPEAIKVLVQKGADPNAKDQYGDTPLHDAIDKGSSDAVDMLIRVKTIDLQAQNSKGFNMLQQAALKGNAHAIERILARDAGHVDRLLDGNYSALHIAANNDHVDCVKLLVENGNAQINLVGQKKVTPLHLACIKAHKRSVEYLLDQGASVNEQDQDGDTPLHCLLGASVDNPGSPAGQDELKRRVNMAIMLLTKGAYPDIRNRKGADILEGCRYSGVRDLVKQFIQRNPQTIKRAGGTRLSTGSPSRGVRLQSAGLGTLLQGMTLPCGAPDCPRMADITLLPCHHKSLCRNCCLNFSECPLCERTIERRIHRRGDSAEQDLANACKQM